MNAQRLIEDAHAAGLSFEIEGDDLIVEVDGDLPPALIAELREHKAELMAVLASKAPDVPPAGQPAPVAADDLDERAALIEVGANVPRRWGEGFAALCTMPAPIGFSP